MVIRNAEVQLWENGSSITVPAGDTVNYCPPLSVFSTVTADVPLNFSAFKSDTVTVTALLKDGTVQTQKILVTFNADGKLSAKLSKETGL